jgi:hypothetical protein
MNDYIHEVISHCLLYEGKLIPFPNPNPTLFSNPNSNPYSNPTRYIEPMNDYVHEVTSHSHFCEGSPEDVIDDMRRQLNLDPR